MIELFLLVVLGLVSYRLTRLIVIDTFFDGIRVKFFNFLANRASKQGKLAFFWNWLQELFSCTFCSGVWVSVAVYSTFLWEYPWDFGRLDWLSVAAIAGVQSLLHSWEQE